MTETDLRTEHHVDTREALLDAAEALFSEHGIQAASLRGITQRAGANLAAVHYHFGSKEGLVRAVFSRRLRPLEEERFRLLEACDLTGEKGIEQVIHAFVAPVVYRMRETPDGTDSFAQLMGRAFMEPSEEVREVLMQQFKPTADRFLGALRRLLPHLSEQELMWRFHFMAGGMGHTVGCRKMVTRFSEGVCDCSDPDGILRYLVTFMASGLRAPATAGPDLQGEPA